LNIASYKKSEKIYDAVWKFHEALWGFLDELEVFAAEAVLNKDEILKFVAGVCRYYGILLYYLLEDF